MTAQRVADAIKLYDKITLLLLQQQSKSLGPLHRDAFKPIDTRPGPKKTAQKNKKKIGKGEAKPTAPQQLRPLSLLDQANKSDVNRRMNFEHKYKKN